MSVCKIEGDLDDDRPVLRVGVMT